MSTTPTVWILLCSPVLQVSALPIHAHVQTSHVAHRYVANASRSQAYRTVNARQHVQTSHVVHRYVTNASRIQANRTVKALLRHESVEAAKGYIAADDGLNVRHLEEVHHHHAALLRDGATEATTVQIPEGKQESFAYEWRLKAQVKFPSLTDGNAPYYSMLGSPVSLVTLGQGRSEYSGGKGMVAFFVSTGSGVGPHGRGLEGDCGGEAVSGHGWIGQKNRVEAAKWYTLDAQKRRNGLTLTTGPGTTGDGTDSTDAAYTATCDTTYTEAEFKMNEVSTINLGDTGVEMQDVELSTAGDQLHVTGAFVTPSPTEAPAEGEGKSGFTGMFESGAWTRWRPRAWQLLVFFFTCLELNQRIASS